MARLKRHEDVFSGSDRSFDGSSDGGGAAARPSRMSTPEAPPPLQPRSPGTKQLSEKVRRLAAAFAGGNPIVGSTAGSVTAGA
jgi:hypothetical protein